MRAQIFGIRRLDFTADNGNHIQGYNLYAGCPDENVDGVRVDKIFIQDAKLDKGDHILKPQVGDWMDFEYDKNGKVASIFSFDKN